MKLPSRKAIDKAIAEHGLIIIRNPGGDLSDAQLDEEISRIEKSLERYDEADPDEVETDEYAGLLTRLTKLREERDDRNKAP